MKEITSHYSLINFKKVNHDRDHVHFSISIPPTMRIGKVVGIIKQNTAKKLVKNSHFKLEFENFNRFDSIGETIACIYDRINYYKNMRIQTALKMPPSIYRRKLLTNLRKY